MPPEWTCNTSAWNDGTMCDCDCGAPDLDCLSHELPITGCASSTGYFCDSSSSCVGRFLTFRHN